MSTPTSPRRRRAANVAPLGSGPCGPYFQIVCHHPECGVVLRDAAVADADLDLHGHLRTSAPRIFLCPIDADNPRVLAWIARQGAVILRD